MRALDGFDAVLSAVTAERMAPRGREAGMVGAEVGVADGASDQARLLALFGRDPAA